MVVYFYRTNSDPDEVNKALTQIHAKECEIKGSNNILSPILVVRDIGDANYCRIMGEPYNGRYYFIPPHTANANGINTLQLSEDVLMSLKGQFLNEQAIIARQENTANLLMNDGEMPVENKNEIYFKQFPTGFSTGFKYLLTIGG